MKNTEKPKYNMWSNSAYMIRLAWKSREKKVVILSILVACLGVATQLVNLYVTPTILAAVENHVSGVQLLTTILAFVAGMMLLAAASAYVDANVLYGRITIRLFILGMVADKRNTTSYPNLNNGQFQRMDTKAKRAASNNRQPTEAVWGTLTDLLKNLLGFAAYGYLLVNVKPMLLAIILVTTGVGYAINHRLSGYGYRHRDELGNLEKELHYFYSYGNKIQSSQLAKDIRIFGLRPWLEEVGDKAIRAYIAFHEKAESVYLWSSIANLVLTFLRNGAAYAYLVSMVLAEEISVSEFLLLFTAVDGFASWITGALNTLGTLYRQSQDLSIVRELLEYPEPFRFEDGENLPRKGAYEIRLENVSFRYPGADADTLSGINLTLHPGEKLAVVGLNGAGKTTLVKLICGFLDPTEGRVLLNGEDIRKYNRRQYYELFSAVFQSFQVLAASIAANVAQTEDDIDMPRVERCIDMAGLTEKIESLPQGYETKLNREVYDDATMLSGGEEQRLMLARALYKDGAIVVLDEPTAALDPIAESDMYQKYSEMTRNKSSVYISHRLASTRFCDRIILIDHGKIAEEGTHDSLMHLGGKYAELFAVQSKYYQKEGNFNEESR